MVKDKLFCVENDLLFDKHTNGSRQMFWNFRYLDKSAARAYHDSAKFKHFKNPKNFLP